MARSNDTAVPAELLRMKPSGKNAEPQEMAKAF